MNIIKILRNRIFCLLIVLLLSMQGCFRSSNSHATLPPPVDNLKPTASISAPDDVQTHSEFTLDGSASSDPEAASLTYTWSLHSKPASSVATMLDPTLSVARVLPDVEGQYLITLTVHDGVNASAPVEKTVNSTDPANQVPKILQFSGPADSVGVNEDAGFTWEIEDDAFDTLTCTLDPTGSGNAFIEIPDCSLSGTYTHQFIVGGSYSPALVVSDAHGAMDGPALTADFLNVTPDFIQDVYYEGSGVSGIISPTTRIITVNIEDSHNVDIESVTVQSPVGEILLSLSPSGSNLRRYQGVIDFFDYPSGPITISVSALDVLGNESQAVLHRTINRVPFVTVTSPTANHAVFKPDRVQINAQCNDPDPDGDCTIEVRVYYPDSNYRESELFVRSSTNILDTPFGLGEGVKSRHVAIFAVDEFGQDGNKVIRRVLVEPSENIFPLVETQGGLLLDFNAEKLLTTTYDFGFATGGLLTILNHDFQSRSRVDDSVIANFSPATLYIANAKSFLTTGGGVTYGHQATLAMTDPPYVWFSNSANTIPTINNRFTLSASGDYLVYPQKSASSDAYSGSVELKQFSTSQNQYFSVSPSFNSHALTDDGRVYFGTEGQLKVFSGGTLSVLESMPPRTYENIKFDSEILYYFDYESATDDYSIKRYDFNTHETLLTGFAAPFPFEVSNGWIAYITSLTLYTRRPDGTLEARVMPNSDINPTALHAMSPDGGVVFSSSGNGYGLYLSLPDGRVQLVSQHFHSVAKYINGKWQVSIGNTVFEVDPDT